VSLGALSAGSCPSPDRETHLSFCLRLSTSTTLPVPVHTADDLTSPLAVSPFRAGHGITVFTTLIHSWPDSVDTTSDRAR
jgi:hypothetical protein